MKVIVFLRDQTQYLVLYKAWSTMVSA